MDMFSKLHVVADEAGIWHLFDQRLKKDEARDWTMAMLIFFSIFLYVPAGLTFIIALHMEGNFAWAIMALLTLVGAFWHMEAWHNTRHNIYLAKYLKRPENSRKLMEILAEQYLPLRVYLYAQKYEFIRGYIENGYLILEFNDGGVPTDIRGLEYERIYTEDEAKWDIIVLNNTGLTLYSKATAVDY